MNKITIGVNDLGFNDNMKKVMQKSIDKLKNEAGTLINKSDYENNKFNYITQPIIKEKVPGRNEPCLCGSDKKYKKCCLNK